MGIEDFLSRLFLLSFDVCSTAAGNLETLSKMRLVIMYWSWSSRMLKREHSNYHLCHFPHSAWDRSSLQCKIGTQHEKIQYTTITACNDNEVIQPYCDGICASDTVSKMQQRPHLILHNTGTIGKTRKHCLLFYFTEDFVVEMLDSLGKDIHAYSKNVVKFLENFLMGMMYW